MGRKACSLLLHFPTGPGQYFWKVYLGNTVKELLFCCFLQCPMMVWLFFRWLDKSHSIVPGWDQGKFQWFPDHHHLLSLFIAPYNTAWNKANEGGTLSPKGIATKNKAQKRKIMLSAGHGFVSIWLQIVWFSVKQIKCIQRIWLLDPRGAATDSMFPSGSSYLTLTHCRFLPLIHNQLHLCLKTLCLFPLTGWAPLRGICSSASPRFFHLITICSNSFLALTSSTPQSFGHPPSLDSMTAPFRDKSGC